MVNLTKRYIEQLAKPEAGKQDFYWDSNPVGFGMRVTSGSMSFIFQRRVNGKSPRSTLGAWPAMSVDTARKIARDRSVQTDQGINPTQQAKRDADKNVTLDNVFTKFIADRDLKERTKSDYKYYIGKYFDDWQHKSIANIDSGMVMARYKKIIENSGAAQASVAMRFLRSIINFAKASYEGLAIPENPVATLSARKAWKKSPARKDHLHQHQIKAFVCALRTLSNPILGAYLEFVLLTGTRLNEAAQLRWSDIDSKTEELTFNDTKNGTARRMPITPRLTELIELLKKYHMGDYVFGTTGRNGKPTHISSPYKALAKANAAAESAVTVHGLRRTYATILESLDCPPYPLKALLGHSMGGDVTTEHYTQITVARIRPWAERYEALILHLVSKVDEVSV